MILSFHSIRGTESFSPDEDGQRAAVRRLHELRSQHIEKVTSIVFSDLMLYLLLDLREKQAAGRQIWELIRFLEMLSGLRGFELSREMRNVYGRNLLEENLIALRAETSERLLRRELREFYRNSRVMDPEFVVILAEYLGWDII